MKVYGVLKRRETGFTLLELMISITILSLIMGVILGAMRLGTRAWEAGEKRIDRLQRMRITYDIISEDIKSILPSGIKKKSDQGSQYICPKGKGCSQKAALFIGESDRIKFVSTNPGLHSSLNKSKYRVVSYYLGQTHDSDHKGVVMEERAWLFPDFFRFETLCSMCETEEDEFENETFIHSIYPDVTELTFRYYGTHDGDEEPDWYETWNTMEDLCSCDPGMIQDSLPEKVEVKMRQPKIMGSDEDEELGEVVFVVDIEAVQQKD
ncbi:MAG: prepilin-type N-terminal cleavage/methylation domain-containing protein [bacterium]